MVDFKDKINCPFYAKDIAEFNKRNLMVNCWVVKVTVKPVLGVPAYQGQP
jgi:hypothetical protein